MAVHKTFDGAFKALYRRIGSAQSDLPTIIANEGLRFFVGSFEKEAFVDASPKPWAVPQRRIPGTKAYTYPKRKDLGRRTRKTLVKTGKLKRAVNNSVTEKNRKRVVWHVRDIPYAFRHNEGEGVPQRKYMGESRTLNRKFREKIIQVYRQKFK